MLAAAAMLVVVLVLTGQPWGTALLLGVVGVVLVGGITALVEVTGVLNASPAPPADAPDDDGPAA
jgi:hypothetical protein